MCGSIQKSFISVFMAVLFSGFMYAQQSSQMQQGSMPSAADTKFMKEAAQGGMAEVELGQLAVEKASNPDVKQFGQRMVDDHTKANDQLKALASQKNVELPQDVSTKDKATKAALEKLSGDRFDKEYMKDMVKDHEKDISDFQKESMSGSDSQVKNFASQTLPTLKDHLKQAQTIAPQVSASASR